MIRPGRQRPRCLRLILLALLWFPCLLTVKFSSGAFGSTAFPFPQVRGWVRSPDIQFYFPKTLFNYIDGAAEQYLRYGFVQLQVAEYRNAEGDLLTVEIYQQGSAAEAFGIYSQEQPSDPVVLDIGARAHVQVPILSCFSGAYYVKLFSYAQGFETQQILEQFARAVMKDLDLRKEMPPILACFPSAWKKPYSEKYIAGDFLGYSFLPAGFTAAYVDSSSSFEVFIIPCADSSGCLQMLNQYLQKTGHPKAQTDHGRLAIQDPYHGPIHLAWRRNLIWGTIGLAGEGRAENYLLLTEDLLMANGFIKP
jgi:hypothetical protein